MRLILSPVHSGKLHMVLMDQFVYLLNLAMRADSEVSRAGVEITAPSSWSLCSVQLI